MGLALSVGLKLRSQLLSSVALIGAQTLLGLLGDSYGLAIDFTDQSIDIQDSGTPANNYVSSGTVSSGALVGPGGKFTYSSPSPKMCLQSDGVMRYGAHNLCLRSQEFDSATWTKANITVSANSTTAPDGTSTADTLTPAGGSSQKYVTQASVVAVSTAPHVVECRFKAGTGQWVQLAVQGDVNGYANFDVLNGTTGSKGSTASASSITSLGSGWYLCSMTLTGGGGGSVYLVAIDGTASTWVQAATTTGTVYAWGFAVRRTPAVTDYIATTSSALYALPYEYSTAGVCQGMLVEEQRTNLLLQSNTFGTTWSSGNITNLTTTTTGPDGVSGSATLLNETVANGIHYITQVTSSSVAAHTFTVFAKQGVGRTRLYVQIDNGGGSGVKVTYDLAGGQVGVAAAGFGGSAFTSPSASVIPFINGWYRCVLTFTSTTAGGFICYLMNDNDSGTAASSTSYAGTVGNGCYIYQAQLEQASYVSSPLGGSPIVTTSATVTRAYDTINIASALFPWSASNGSVFAEYVKGDNDGATVVNVIGGASGGISIGEQAGNYQRISIRGVADLATTANAATAGSVSKVAAAVKSGDHAIVLNAGTAATSATVAALGAAPLLGIGYDALTGAGQINGYIRKHLYLPRRASNAELQTVTTP